MTGNNFFSRRQIVATAAAAAPLLGMPAILRGASPDAPVADSAQGRLKGLAGEGVMIFRGIPYGGSVSGPARRFLPPPPPESWTGIRDATMFGAPSIQAPRGNFGNGEPAPAEDCLFLNVWTPALDGRKRPVLVYQHGGGFVIGSGAAPWQDGGKLARKHDVVVVQSNHRLGLMGYLYLGQLLGPEYAGNQGLQDLVAALAWVRTNIAGFGGDPDNVTIFGESGGGGKTSALYTMPSAAPYFHKASIESPIGPGRMTPEAATQVARVVMERLAITDPRALLTVPASDIIKAQLGNAPFRAPGTVGPPPAAGEKPEIMIWPFIDGTILPEEPFTNAAPAISAQKPLIVGSCKDEAVFFQQGDKSAFSLDEAELRRRLAPKLGDRASAWIDIFRKSRPNASPSQLYMAILTAKPWRALAVEIAERKAQQGTAPVYSYILDYPSPEKVRGTDYAQGSPHASDIPMKFDTAGQFGPKDPARLKTASNMGEMWATFARTGRPGAKGQPNWKPYSVARRETMIIDAQCRLVNDPEQLERQFFSKEANAARE
ncbi:carboxylesterase family protein [Sphingobium sp. H39-3-25]|uniref:carboxylesterase/lipase family protein n=1 Tax=Sphingobium arseniciresistens TaxID=3030834 RepID=UPI0023B94398|nr:carboxylesterase family protein [Sphingobium arseniciresistens]